MSDDPTFDEAASVPGEAAGPDAGGDHAPGDLPDHPSLLTPAEAAEAGAAETRPPLPAWIPVSIIGALVIGAALGVGGTLLFWNGADGGDDPTQQAQAAAGPDAGGSPVPTIAAPQVGSEDPDAYGTVEITGTRLPRLDGQTDAALGMAAPDLRGFDFEGNPVAITNDGQAKIILFVAHWCPYCRDEVPVVRDWVGAADLPPDVDVYSVSTLTDFTRGNYPPRTWLEQEQWNVPLIVDDHLDTAAGAFGLNAVPFWVFVDESGVVVGRFAGGGVPATWLTSVAQELSPTATPPESGS